MTKETIARLVELVPPPAYPVLNVGDWNEVEASLGLVLPDTYKLLINTYGQGVFEGRHRYSGLLVSSFFGPVDASRRATATSEYFASIESLSYATYPTTPGLIGFATYADEDSLAWHTVGEPDSWPLVYHDVETGFIELGPVDLLELVIAILEERSLLHPNIIKEGHMEGPHSFRVEE